MRVVIVGCGYVGTALGERLADEGETVFGLRREPSGLPDTIEPVIADTRVPASLVALPTAPDVIVHLAGPSGHDEAAYRATYVDGLRNTLAVIRERGETPRVLFASSTAVYGDMGGEWVDEDTPTNPDAYNGRILLEAESLLRESGLRTTAVRFGGIYGPGRTRLLDEVRQGRARVPAEPVYGNRIHRDDAAGVLRHLMRLEAPAPVYVAVDDEPAEKGDVLRHLASLLDAPAPEQAEGEGGRSPFHGNKRCSNRRLRESGYVFEYPTYREGYRALLAAR